MSMKKLTRAEKKALKNGKGKTETKITNSKDVPDEASRTGVDKEAEVQKILENSFIQPYLKNKNITDINYDGVKIALLDNVKGPVYPKEQPSEQEVSKLINQIVNIQGMQLNTSSPIMDTEIGYLRVNAVSSAASPDGMTFSMRVSRPRLAVSDIADMTAGGEEDIGHLLNVLIQAKSNIIISGETGTGKTELQKLLVNYISDDDLIVLIEDTRDSHIKALYPKKNIKSWQTLTSPDRERKIYIHDLVKAALRNFPKWLLVAETRGSEAADMLDSAKTGHALITTLHAISGIDIPSRLMSMVRQSEAYSQVSDLVIGREVTKFLRFGIHLEASMEKTGVVRRIKEIVEYTGYDESGPTCHYLYRASNKLIKGTDDYELVEEFGEISEVTHMAIQDRKLYHLLPERFRPGQPGGPIYNAAPIQTMQNMQMQQQYYAQAPVQQMQQVQQIQPQQRGLHQDAPTRNQGQAQRAQAPEPTVQVQSQPSAISRIDAVKAANSTRNPNRRPPVIKRDEPELEPSQVIEQAKRRVARPVR